jgi:hypothetical protein
VAGDINIPAFARQIIKEGRSANSGLTELKALGAGIRRQDWLSIVREVRTAMESQATGIDRPGHRRPYRREILVMSTTVATGFIQYVDVWVKDGDTGEIGIRPYGIRTDDLMTHDDAIETALDRMTEHSGDYNEMILGGTYMATYELIPVNP